jgi:hypothetical protein
MQLIRDQKIEEKRKRQEEEANEKENSLNIN